MRGNEEFWLADRARQWPRDLPGWIFLARAYHHLGGLRFGPAWAGTEPLVDTVDNEINDHSSPTPSTNQLERRKWVEETIIDAGSHGKLKAAVLLYGASSLVDIPALKWTWGGDHWFCSCQMNIEHPHFDDKYIYGVALGRDTGYIFLEKVQFKEFCLKLAPRPQSEPWMPGPEAQLGNWCTSHIAEMKARERLGLGPLSERAICRELTRMWRDCGRPCGDGSIGTIRATDRKTAKVAP